ncbi:hypothetical protein, conserved [Plasmodium vivax]|uniref:MORN repeat protein n=1 Tax=Plasmodium vivax (strain Salvador I) TaxID=126793 RepID=A5K9L1_PLAVS|nr:hypothetical protein, conserved [Plasmodium vivax]EDL44083.1 hypothetical protein, conserved [Plasmodium vivax]|eukprot:XP_001613810.1 hypothetical protein [Plasmodium vivax Sal-1]
MEGVSHPPWEASFWKSFFIKKRHPQNGQSQSDSSVEMKPPATLHLKSIHINNYTIDGELPLDAFHCAHLGKDVVIQKGNETYMGNFKGRNVDGFGKIISPQFVYVGHIRNGEKWGHGKGTFLFGPSAGVAQSSVVTYKGEWKGNKRNGYGVLSVKQHVNCPRVKTYEGWWRQNERHFYGVQRYANAVYCGFWAGNRRSGFGRMCWFAKGVSGKGERGKGERGKGERGKGERGKGERGKTNEPRKGITSGRASPQKGNTPKKVIQNVYVGEWQNDEMHGYGTYFWLVRHADRKKTPFQNEGYDKYEGYWRKGERHGFGVFHHRGGDTYLGSWKDNKKHGGGYLLKTNGTLCKCSYLHGEVTSQVELNQTYIMNHLYTNSICTVVNLGPLLQEDPNLTNGDIKQFYKIVYDHFDLLIKAYELYRRKGGSNKRSITQEVTTPPLGSFTLKNLWHMFYDANIIHSSFPLSSLNRLAKDDMSVGENDHLANLLFCENHHWVEEDTLLDEEDMVKSFFQSSRFPTGVHSRKGANRGSRNPNGNKATLCEGTRSAAISSHVGGQTCGAAHPVSTPPYEAHHTTKHPCLPHETHNPMAHILLNKDLFLVRCFAKFYKNQWKKQRCYHMKRAKLLLKKISLFLLINKSKHNNGYLFYVLFCLFHSAFPLWYASARMSGAWLVGRAGGEKGKGNSGIHRYGDTCGDASRSDHLNKYLALLNLSRYNIHDERRKISFNSFVYTLARVSLHLRDVRGEHQTRVMVSLLNALKGCVREGGGQKRHPKRGTIKGGLKKGRKKRSRGNQVGWKRPPNKCEKKGGVEKGAENGRKASAEKCENDVCPKKCTHSARRHGLGPGRAGEARQRGGNFHEKKNNKKVKKVKKVKKTANAGNAANTANVETRGEAPPSCAVCCHRGAPPTKPKGKKKKNGSPQSGKEGLTALVNILDNFVYYFIFYFLLFNSTEKRFSLLSAKLNVSLRLGDVLKFLLQLKLTRKDETTGGEARSINLGPHHHYDDYRPVGRGRTNIKAKKWKPLHILNSANEREEKEGTTLPMRQTNNNHSTEEGHTKSPAKRNSYIAHTASHLQRMRKKKKKKKKKKFHLNRSGKNDSRKKKVLKKFSRMFCLSFVQVLAIFSKTLNTPNLHLTNESTLQLCLSRRNEREKIDKHRLQNNAVRYIVLLNEEKKKILNRFATCTKRKSCSEEVLPNREKGETGGERPCPVHTKGYKNKLVNELNEQVKQLEVENFEQVAKDPPPPCVQLEKEKKRNKRGGRKDEKKGPKGIHSDVEQFPQVMSHEGGHAHVRIKRKSQVRVALHRLRKRFAHARKNYMNVLDYYNMCVTPYELGLFFLRFVRVVRRKRGINSSYGDALFFFVFHVLLRRAFRLARRARAHP